MAWIPDYSPRHIQVAQYMATMGDEQTTAQIAAGTGMSESTAYDALVALHQPGLMVCRTEPGSTTRLLWRLSPAATRRIAQFLGVARPAEWAEELRRRLIAPPQAKAIPRSSREP